MDDVGTQATDGASQLEGRRGSTGRRAAVVVDDDANVRDVDQVAVPEPRRRGERHLMPALGKPGDQHRHHPLGAADVHAGAGQQDPHAMASPRRASARS